jgi:hypothetical protein
MRCAFRVMKAVLGKQAIFTLARFYDGMLEMDGVLAKISVPLWPSMARIKVNYHNTIGRSSIRNLTQTWLSSKARTGRR